MLITLSSHSSESGANPNTNRQAKEAGYILHERAQQYHWEGQETLSIKSFFGGKALYTLGKGSIAVDDSSYLLINHDQPYTIDIDSSTTVESLCIFFERGFVEEVHRTLTTSTQALLDTPEPPTCPPLHFFERTYRHDNLISPLLLTLRTQLPSRRGQQIWLYEILLGIAQRLLQLHLNVFKEVEALPALRAATREELYRRLYRAREYASAFYDTPVTINELAQIAALSPNHFLRTFKQLFRQTPHQYLIQKRLERASELLISTDCSVTEICFALGFESPGSFSWLFHQRTGCSPTAYRAQKK
ncbi:MAG TPA: AraC family transcriptional regulator [Ktedonobacteraceae bacterium]|nr:AraC family transcriptional regulator [Ktedonobacteraceae bacterium]